MKRLISLLIVFALAFSGLCAVANSEDNSRSEPVETRKLYYVWFSYPTAPEPDFTEADYGEDLASIRAYVRDYRAFKSAYYESNNRNAVEQITAVAEVEITNISRLWPYATMNINPDDTAKIEELDIVSAVEEVIDIQATDDEVYPDNRFAFECHRFLMRHGSEGAEYRELYYHYTADDTVDWALVYFLASPAADECISVIFADRIILEAVQSAVFLGGYGVYDVAADDFYTLHSLRDEPDRYPGLVEAVWEQKVGRPLGDADGDNELTILDATRIQRVLAGLAETDIEIEAIWNFIDSYEAHANVGPCGFSDADKDGEVTILDATRIQRKLAGLVN